MKRTFRIATADARPRVGGGSKRGQENESLGRSHGDVSTKIHLKTDFDGFPIAFILTGGEASDSPQFATLLDIGPEITPRAALADKGYDSKANRAAARKRGTFAPRFLIDQTENRYRISISRFYVDRVYSKKWPVALNGGRSFFERFSNMALKTYNPSTPGLRQLVLVDRSELYRGKPLKALTEGKAEKGGRNNAGRITVRFRGGGHKQSYRIIDFKRRKLNVPAKVERLEYDPNRSAFIALIKYVDGEQAYIIAPQRLVVGDEVVAGVHVDVKPGNAMPLSSIPVGTMVHNVELKIGKGGALARSAGTYAQIVARDESYVNLRLRSGEQRLVHGECFATVGVVSNPNHMSISLGKAGRNRWLGRMPHNRGVSMNPVDHPHGGGEGKTSGGRHPVTPWGKGTKGTKTRRNKSTDKFVVSSRHSHKKKG